MATGRTVLKWTRAYMSGYNHSGYGRTIGPLTWEYDVADLTCPMGDAVRGGLPNHANIGIGTFEVAFNALAAGLPSFRLAGHELDVMIPVGIQAAPAIGDPVFCGTFQKLAHQTHEDGGALVASIPFGAFDPMESLNYSKPWGLLHHDLSAETAVNSVITDTVDHGAQTLLGGWMMYQVIAAAGAGDMTATIKIQHSATNVDGDFADLAGATSGVINCVGGGVSGIAQCATDETVERYTRWQIVLGTATSVTFALAFIRI